eukprot:TRINITY_DN103407_c0_g1_i1.p1 TRINITY_DN103407_c0_g1~~TRINITY_DN103407_c0_g1_i1.p1  ORF type:complete len:326 (+),score=53.11 TRINITY_DN103407_c0_g1_i1:235-1212(+)
MAFPVRAVRARVSANSTAPWAGYLPQALRILSKAQTVEVESLPTVTEERLPSLLRAARRQPLDCWSSANESSKPHEDMAGCIWELSQHSKGCRRVQLVVERNLNDEFQQQVARELQGHVLEAMRCPHANHVLQKLIKVAKPQTSHFIVEELMSTQGCMVMAARHKYGCRIVQRILEHFPHSQIEMMIEAILGDAVPLACHPYGNYVLQNLLRTATEHQRARLLKQLQTSLALICQDTFGCAVVVAAVSCAPREDVLCLIRLLLKEHGLLASMAHSRHGHLVVPFVLDSLQGQELRDAQEVLREQADSLQSCKWGRSVMALLEASA